MIPLAPFPIIFFIFGLIVGSFLNVVIYRMNTTKSLGGRSACTSCQSKLRWYELIPVFSFFALRGRCRSCKIKISYQYPIVELATGIIFAALFIKLSDVAQSVFYEQDFSFLSLVSFFITYAYYAGMFSILVVIAVYDLKHKIIPDILSFIFGILAFTGLFFFSISFGFFDSIFFNWHIPSIQELFSGVLIASPFYLLWLASGGAWMGLGDAKLALGLGWFLGLGLALSAVTLAFFIGATFGLCFVVYSKSKGFRKGMKSEIPFAIHLVLGACLAFIFELRLFPSF